MRHSALLRLFCSMTLVGSALMAQLGWSPWNFPAGASTPPGQPATFTPIEVFPRAGDLGYDSTRECARTSGMVLFVDPMGTADPNDDREYLVVGRSDGVFLVDVTPSPTAVVIAALPATNRVQFISESNPILRPELSLLNGSAVSGAGGNYPPYCGLNVIQTWNSLDTPNREVAVFQRTANDFVIYGVSRLRPGIWALVVFRETSGPNAGLLSIDTSAPDTWLTLGGAIGEGHHIVISQEHAQAFVADDSHAVLQVIGLSTADPHALILVRSYSVPNAGFHEAFIKGGKVWASVWPTNLAQLPSTHVFVLPVTAASPLKAAFDTVYSGGHSCYVDEMPMPVPHLWMLAEDARASTARANIDRIRMDVIGGQSVEHIPFLAKPGYQYGITGNDADPSLVHNMRGNGRTAFPSNYTDGIGLADLSGSVTQMVAGFDITDASFPSQYATWQVPAQFPTVGHRATYEVLDNYRGAWDVVPYTDSGLVHLAGGEKGAITFRVNHGHPNRYWRSTPFPGAGSSTPSPSEGVFPKIIVPGGPAKAGVPLMLMDANRANLASLTATGQLVRYRWWLATAKLQSPPSVATTPWTHSGTTRNVDFNLDSNQPYQFYANPLYGSDVFVLTDLLSGDVMYLQMFVEEEVKTAQGWVPSGAWSASRGTWIGVLPVGTV